MKNVWYYNYPIGCVGITEEKSAISGIFFKGEEDLTDVNIAETPLIQRAASQLDEYFDGKRTVFDLPLSLHGTDFERSVWTALMTIPFGETRSYKDIAIRIGNPKASRAVGMANHNNPISIVVPCHRVIGQDGSLTGYAGGLAAKQYLLDLEKHNV